MKLGRGGTSSVLPNASQAWPSLSHLRLLQQVMQGCQILLRRLHPFDSHLDVSEHGEIRYQLLIVLQTHLLAEHDLQNQTVKQNLGFRQKRKQRIICYSSFQRRNLLITFHFRDFPLTSLIYKIYYRKNKTHNSFSNISL